MSRRITSDDGADAALEALVAACIEASAIGDDDGVEALLAARPDLAGAARALLDDLARSGLLDEQPNTIGPYRILEPLGRGGMGMVYLAEQREPVRRRVALKLIKRGMDTHEVLARFAAERQALALMNHPNIAKVFDAGATSDGRPYFVMEHIAGLPITDYCDRKGLDTTRRIELVIQACDGVQHAHHKGIVHRDLKPSNLLVAEQDGRPVPKIIDFGIAKATDQRLGGATLHTAQGVLLGTPEYMSPEQAGRDALDVDLRTDVWSLGVVLYELLTGELPFSSQRLRTDPLLLQRVLREEQLDSPSRRLATRRDETIARARQRSTTGPELVRRLRGDLDWICLKALEKERERRYATVHELAADLRRHLDHEPVLAGPPSTVYRLSKFVQRHRLPVAAAIAVLIALLAGLVTSLVYYREADAAATVATDALRSESAAREAAERDFRTALSAVDLLLTRVADARLEGVPRMDGVRRRILEDAKALFAKLLEARHDDPEARFQAARSRAVLARTLSSLGDVGASLEQAIAASDELAALVAAEPDDRDLRFEYAKSLDIRAQSLIGVDREVDARSDFAAALDLYRALLADGPDDVQVRRYLVGELMNVAYAERNRTPERALALWQEAVTELDAMRGTGEDADWVERMTAIIESSRAGTQIVGRDLTAAEASLDRARRALAHFDLKATLDVELIEAAEDTFRKLGILYYMTGKLPEAQRAADAQAEAASQLVEDHPDVPSYRALLAGAHGNRAVFRAATGIDTETREAFRAAADTLEALVRDFPDDASYRRSLGVYSGNLANALLIDDRRSDLDEARRRATRALELSRRMPDDDPSKPSRIAGTLEHLVDIERGDGHLELAARHADDAVSALPDDAAVTAPDAYASAAYAVAIVAFERGDLARARAMTDAAGEACDRALEIAPDDFELHKSRARIARVDGLTAAASGDASRAAEIARDLPEAFGADAPAEGLVASADVLARAALGGATELADEAEAMCRRALAAFAPEPAEPEPTDRKLRATAQILLATLRHRAGHPDGVSALLDVGIGTLLSTRRSAQLDAIADQHLRAALRLRAEIALQAEDTETVRTTARALVAEFEDQPGLLDGARLLVAAGDPAGALDLLERCAAARQDGLASALDAAAFDAVRTEPRFVTLRRRLR